MSWFTFAIVSILCCGPLTCFLPATPLLELAEPSFPGPPSAFNSIHDQCCQHELWNIVAQKGHFRAASMTHRVRDAALFRDPLGNGPSDLIWATRDTRLVSCPDPTLCEGKGSGEFGHNPWARERNLSAPMRLQL